MKVLIAEDSLLQRKVLEEALIKWGYEVVVTKNGLEAWEVLQQEDGPRLAILDWVMPGLDGLEVCKRVTSRPKGGYIYVILLTGKGSKEDIIKGLEAGADDYIIKPFHEEELKYRIKIGQRVINLENRILQLASTDHLTGLLNRRAFFERMESELGRVKRSGEHISFIMVDIDNFKAINDQYGHLAGDKILQAFGAFLQNSLRTYDFVGRYGGEEFIICLPGAQGEEVLLVAERLRYGTEKLAIEIGKGCPLGITASFGVFSPPTCKEITVDFLITKIDEALYKAKSQGKNQVYLAL